MRKFIEFIFRNVANKNLDIKTAESIIKEYQREMKENLSYKMPSRDIAVIGVSCKFGKADNPEEFWHNIQNGISCLEEIPNYRWDKSKRYSEDKYEVLKSYSKWGSFVENANKFDSEFFDQSDNSATVMDPQQRLFLHLCWDALDNSGYGSKNSRENRDIGIFVGARGNVYNTEEFVNEVSLSKLSRKENIEFIRSVLLGKAPNMIAAAVSNYLDLKGPSVVIDTACSSSLVSVHLACQSILNGDCDMAIAGGIEVIVDPNTYVYLSKINALSTDGKCKTFDRNANGYVPGEGGGAVILKELNKAIKDKDNIIAIIKGSAVNNDGYTVGVTTPDIKGQKDVIKKAFKNAGVSPDSITLIEAHGTGTFLGDPIEFRALSEVFKEATHKLNYCGLGTVKSNLGHLHSAAGIASFIKIALALSKAKIPATLNCKEPNPRFNLISSPFYISDSTTNWKSYGEKRRAGISSFGFGGTNCHMILEEWNENYSEEYCGRANEYLAVYSAKKDEALSKILKSHLEYIKNKNVNLNEYCYTLNTGRELFERRRCINFKDIDELKDKLINLIQEKENSNCSMKNMRANDKEDLKIAMMFPGQGSQYYGMAKELYEKVECFREHFNKCDSIISKYIGKSIKDIIYSTDNTSEIINETSITQPIVFAIGYSIGKMWMDMGVEPVALIGHSVGEYVAACIGGVFTLEDAIKIVVKRGQLMNGLDINGGMMVVFSDEKTVRKVYSDSLDEFESEISISALNGPYNTVIAGLKKDLNIIKNKFLNMNIKTRNLDVSHPFHSALMKPILEQFRNELKSVTIKKTNIPIVSNITGKFTQDFHIDYWVQHIIQPVRFYSSLITLVESNYKIFLEAGPGTTLTSMMKRIKELSNSYIIPTINGQESDLKVLLKAIATIINEGGNINFNRFYGSNKSNKTILPNYPFDYKEYWVNQEKKDDYNKVGFTEIYNVNDMKANSKNLTYALFDRIDKNSNDSIELEKTVGANELKVIRNHIVGNDIVMPGVCFWEMAQIAAIFTYGKITVKLKRIVYPMALTIRKDEETKYKLSLNKETGRFTVSSLTGKDNKNWNVTTSGTIDYLTTMSSKSINILEIKERLKYNHVSGETLRENFKLKGLIYGEDFYSIVSGWCGKDEAITELKFKPKEYLENYMYHPGVLDGALQGIALVNEVNNDKRTFIPYRVEEISYFGLLTEDCFGYIKLLNYNKENGFIEFNVLITDCYGNVKVEISKMCLKALNTPTNTNEYFEEKLKPIDEFYKPFWTKQTKVERNNVIYDNVLLFADNKSHHYKLSSNLENEGYKVVKIYKGNYYLKLDEKSYMINPYDKYNYEALFNELYKDGIEVNSIIYGFNSEGIEESIKSKVQDEMDVKSLGLMHLVSSLKNQSLKDVYIAVLTNNAFIVNQNDKVLNYGQAAVLGAVRTIPHEYGNIKCTLIDVENYSIEDNNTVKLVSNELRYGFENEIICFRNGERYIQSFKKDKFEVIKNNKFLLKEGGVYVIAGGLGGLGLEIAKSMAQRVKCKIILLGRSSLPARSLWNELKDQGDRKTRDRIVAISEIEMLGSEVLTLAVDICDEASIVPAIDYIRYKFSYINGVINAAGLLHDALISRTTKEIYDKVTSPKVQGSLLLDIATSRDELDFFILFSAMGTYFGNIGQYCYSIGNAFQDSFAAYRNLIKNKKTIVINWGTWSEVGLVANDFKLKSLEAKGVLPLSTEEAIEAFYSCLVDGNIQYGIVKLSKVLEDKLLNRVKVANEYRESDKVNMNYKSNEINIDVENSYTDIDIEITLKKHLLNKINKLQEQPNKIINYKTSFLDAGLDSMTIVEFTENFEKETGIKLYPTVLFEYPTIQELCKYLITNNKLKVESFFRNILDSEKDDTVTLTNLDSNSKVEEKIYRSVDNKEIDGSNNDIAVIGMAGVFPESDDIYEYWDNLINGCNCIKEIPEDRWIWKEFYSTNKEKGKTYSKWGGFIKGIDLFDPLFFNLSPKEAVSMDPQQRFFLKVVWEALEDAGYADGKIFSTRTGVFVGVSNHNYFDESFDSNNIYSGLSTSNAIVANRVSYFLDLKGPSMSIDTQCSSSLVALNEACKSISLGECDFAIAGGVNCLIPKDYYILLSQMEAISKEGSCKTFDKKSDGFISGEGAGALLLKKLSDAIRDGDNIHCVIKGCEVNHDGRSASLTAPNSKSQAELIKRCIEKTNIDPNTITYIETHGTGTPLGDPIEVKGLIEAFEQFTNKKNYCGLGAVKSNIGHLESAAGMASIIKVIMAMKNNVIPGNLHFKEKNPFIDFINSPFYVIDRAKKWVSNGVPMRAGISSFGMGGTNAHVILEEAPQIDEKASFNITKSDYPIFISAKNEKALKEYINKLIDYLRENQDLNISDISYTLNTGRYNFAYRIAVIASSVNELLYKLENAKREGFKSIESKGVFYGKININDTISHISTLENEAIKVVLVLPKNNKRTFDRVFDFMKNTFVNNKLFMEIVDECELALQSMGISIKEFLEKEREYYEGDICVKVCNFIFGLTMYKLIKSLKVEIVKTIGDSNEYSIIDVVENKKSIKESLLNIINRNIEFDEPRKHRLHSLDMTNEYVINLGLEDFINDSKATIDKEKTVYFFDNEHDTTKNFMKLLSKLYIKCGNVNINTIYSEVKRKLISLPTYAFQNKSYWYAKEINMISKNEIYDYSLPKSYFYEWDWNKAKANEPLMLNDESIWIIFCDNEEFYKNITELLENKNQKVVLIFNDGKYLKKNNYEYTIDVNKQSDYQVTFKNILEDFGRVDVVVNLCSYRTNNNYKITEGKVREWVKENIYCIFGIALGLKNNFDKVNEVNLISITNESMKLTDSYKSNIDASCYPVHVFSRLIAEEIDGVSSRTIDLDSGQDVKAQLKDALFNYSLTKDGISELIYRNGIGYTRSIKQCNLNIAGIADGVWKKHGVYVITGGVNGIGAEVALHIAKKVRSTIILIGRTRLPDKKEFNNIIKDSKDEKIIKKIKNIMKIQEAGADVEYYCTDISDEFDAIQLFDGVVERFGEITGVFHCAGTKKDSIMTSKSFKDFDEVMATKAMGINNIKKAVSKYSVDFVIAFSSIAALYGTPGQSDYSCANAFMDAFVRDWAENTKTFVASINWTLWNGVGMDIPILARRKMEKEGLLPLEIDEGIEALELILSDRKRSNYIVMKLSNPTKFMKDLVELKTRTIMSDKNVLFSKKKIFKEEKTFESKNKSVEVETKKFLIDTLSELLYLDSLDIDTTVNLGDYGMDSLSIKEALAVIEKHYDTVLEPSLFEENPNIDSLANYLASKFGNHVNEEGIEIVEEKEIHESDIKNYEADSRIEAEYDINKELKNYEKSIEDIYLQLYEGHISVDYAKEKIAELLD